MKTIYKYPLQVVDKQIIYLPIIHKILSIQEQNNTVCIWALVESDIDTVPVNIIIKGTGLDCEDVEDCLYLQSVQVGPFVWHIFMKI